MKKIVSLLISMLVLSVCFTTVLAQPNTRSTEKKHDPQPTMNPYIDELDQSMTTQGGVLPVGAAEIVPGVYVNLSVAQSFIPQKEVLTRVQFLMAKNLTTTYPCSFSIRENITGQDLTSIQLGSEQFPYDPAHPTNLSWVTFDFPDIWVTPGQTYYMMISTANVTDNFYAVGGNGSNLYPNGTAYWSLDNGNTWQPIPPGDGDGCFKTYGLQETTLSMTPGGGFFPSFTIQNTGNVTAWDINITLGINGGLIIFGNHLSSFYIPELSPGNYTTIKTGFGFIFGFGNIEITLTIKAANVRESSTTVRGVLILFFIVGLH
jgi:hypothetical protein